VERGGEKAQLFWLGIFRPMGSNAPVTAASFAARVRRQKSPTRSQGRFQVRSWQPLQAVCRLDAHRSSSSAAAGAFGSHGRHKQSRGAGNHLQPVKACRNLVLRNTSADPKYQHVEPSLSGGNPKRRNGATISAIPARQALAAVMQARRETGVKDRSSREAIRAPPMVPVVAKRCRWWDLNRRSWPTAPAC
jgi:hypothetical protein